MAPYTVKAVRQVAASPEGADRPWTRQKVRIVDAAGEITDGQLFCNRFVPVPKEGDTLDVDEIKQPENPAWLPEIKLVRKGGGGGGGPRPEDPKRMASIAMQHSQDTALRMVTWALENGVLKPPADDQRGTYGWLRDQVVVDADYLYQQVQGAQKNA